MKVQQCVLIMAGGTGGHIFPAMAVARSLLDQDSSVYWLGTETGMEKTIVPAANIELHSITVKGFRGKNLIAKITAPLLLLLAIWQAIKIIRKIKPDVVVGFGGYVSAPGGIAARLLGKPLIIHEQNSVAGSTNKLLARLTPWVLEAFPHSLPKAQWVGNPVRDSIRALYKKKQPAIVGNTAKRLLIMGGSLGAESINKIVPQSVSLLTKTIRLDVWHQTGKGKLGDVSHHYREINVDARVEEFITEVEAAYQWADIIICRAGALTVSEIAVVGVPAIFIPYPYAIDNHQLTNAQWLEEKQAACIVEQKQLTAQHLAAVLTELLTDDERLCMMTSRLVEMAIPDATDKVVAICNKLSVGEINHAA